MSSLKIILLWGITLFLLGNLACTKQPKEHYLKKETFSRALQEMLIIRYLKVKDPEKAALVKDVFKKYRITKKEFEATKAHYAQNPQFWADVFKSIRQRLEEENRRLQKKVKNQKRK